MTKANTTPLAIATTIPSPRRAFADVQDSFDRFCLISGIEAMEQMLEEDACQRRSKNLPKGGVKVGQLAGVVFMPAFS